MLPRTLGRTLEEYATEYRGFCRKYKPQPKPEKRSHWGSKLLGGMNVKQKPASKKKSSPGQLSLPWNQCQVSSSPQVKDVAEKFILANCYKS